MVQVHLGPPPTRFITGGGVAQMGERLLCTQEAIGSTPFTSTRSGVDGIGSLRFFDSYIGKGFLLAN